MIDSHSITGAVRACALALLLALSAFPAHAETAPDPEKARLIKKLLTVSGIADQLAYMKDGVLNSYSQMVTASYPKVPQAFWKDFNGLMGKKEMDALLDRVVPVYAKHMSVETIEKLVAMFETPFWQEWKDKMPEISREAGQIGQQWAMRLTQSKEFQKRIDRLVAKHELEKLNKSDGKQ